METIIRPFVGDSVAPSRLFAPNGRSAPPVHLAIGLRGGTKTFSFSGSATMSSYMAAVHTEKSVDAFDMETGKVRS